MKRFYKSFGCNPIATACVAAVALAAGCATPGPDQSAATPADTIFSRKIVMDTINNQMDEREGMLAAGGKGDLDGAREAAEGMPVLFMAFPHLFPPRTNQWKPNVERDAGRDTYASPDLWQNFADFYGRAGNASKIAFAASRAKNESELRTLIAELRVVCTSCHAAYLKTD